MTSVPAWCPGEKRRTICHRRPSIASMVCGSFACPSAGSTERRFGTMTPLNTSRTARTGSSRQRMRMSCDRGRKSRKADATSTTSAHALRYAVSRIGLYRRTSSAVGFGAWIVATTGALLGQRKATAEGTSVGERETTGGTLVAGAWTGDVHAARKRLLMASPARSPRSLRFIDTLTISKTELPTQLHRSAAGSGGPDVEAD